MYKLFLGELLYKGVHIRNLKYSIGPTGQVDNQISDNLEYLLYYK